MTDPWAHTRAAQDPTQPGHGAREPLPHEPGCLGHPGCICDQLAQLEEAIDG